MVGHSELIQKLTILNEIAEMLNHAQDIYQALDEALARLVALMELETGWILLKDPSSKNRWFGRNYTLAAHCNLPPAMAPDKARAWKGDCECQGLCNRGEMDRAYNEVRCSRLSRAGGERNGLAVHASTPLRSGARTLGILNVAAPDWDAFSPEALALLTNAGSQMGIALERARLFDLIQERRIHEQAALLDLSHQLLSRPGLEDLVSYLVEEVRSLLSADACAMLLPCEDGAGLIFSATSGWNRDPAADGRRVPEDAVSGPGLAMQTQQPLLIEDIARDTTAPWSPDWIRTEGFRGHAVMPLIAEGRSIGALVIDMRRPRRLNEDETRFLRLMANQAAIAIEKARLHREAVRQQRLEEELEVSREIQRSMLPGAAPDIPGWDFAATYEAARLVGGDFYDFFTIPRHQVQLGMVIADVADKGIPAALFMALSRTVIRTVAISGRSPGSALMRANDVILNDTQSDLFLSVFYGRINVESGRLVYANAGHNPPLWFRAETHTFQKLDTHGIVLGVLEAIELEEDRVDIAPGDVLVLYTDGVTEAMGAAGEEFGLLRLQAVVAEAAEGGASARDILKAVVGAVGAFTSGLPQTDDFTLCVVRRMVQ